ncbi:hypothetical protein HD554DRAFT_2330956 [Boletus coccyginus]|nr:hypothetical protein HD554DRAFT_2330956 [Boletus coccyginus]
MAQTICGPLPLIAALGVTVLPTSKTQDTHIEHYIPQDPKAWLSHSTIYYGFLGNAPEEWQKELVEDAITEYTRHVNVNLIDASDDKTKSADIRISFVREDGAWSAIGTDALKIPKEEATMNLGFLTTKPNENNRDQTYNLVLHEFGHAFGLAHEWDPDWAKLKSDSGKPRAFLQHTAAYRDERTSNFRTPDTDSIMKFFVPEDCTTDGDAVALKGGLSKNDKAWLNLIYPGKADRANEDTGILESLNVLNVPLETSSRILLGATVSEIRFHYHEYISTTWQDRLSKQAIKAALEHFKKEDANVEELKPESHVLQGKVTGITPLVDHNSEDDLYDAVAAAVLDPQFSQVLANIVNQNGDGVQNSVRSSGIISSSPFLGSPQSAIPSGTNPQAAADVQNFLGPLLSTLGGVLGQVLLSGLPTGAASGVYPQALPPNVEQGIFNVLTKFVKNPVFLNIVKDIASDVIVQHNSSS